MKTLLSRCFRLGLLMSLLMSLTTEATQAQVGEMYRGSIKDHVKVRPRLKKDVPYAKPRWAVEASRRKVKPLGLKPVEISPIPTPIPGPVFDRGRVEISPIPTPIPYPGSATVLEMLDHLIDMHTEAVLRGDLGAADLIEEVIIIVPDFIIDPYFMVDLYHIVDPVGP